MINQNQNLVRVRNVRHAFGARKILKGVSFELGSSDIVGLIGPGGSGKSVLLKILTGIYPPVSGNIEFVGGGHPSISLLFQEGALFDSLSVFDNVAFPLVRGKVPATNLSQPLRDEVYHQVSSILGRVGLGKDLWKMPAQLSGGMRKRVALARALVSNPDIVLLDDPTAGLDPVASSVIMALIRELHEEFRPACIIVSHDLRRLLPSVDRILALFNGEIVFDGNLETLSQNSTGRIRDFVSCRYDFG